ncbi:hypothetical protein HOK51_07485 [Candidatus Woesearchaeota archaeon]|jgi:hypothetical protein|nr:hypothetical protein [Candidatus Woesearchaeota archaeon]MBT6519665.1 hypothetical protein [Candidatus Woesearchaeota archaeon]MBT7368689.1 hypothetical protein [Candidatus Woesearchaeota archaeon]
MSNQDNTEYGIRDLGAFEALCQIMQESTGFLKETVATTKSLQITDTVLANETSFRAITNGLYDLNKYMQELNKTFEKTLQYASNIPQGLTPQHTPTETTEKPKTRGVLDIIPAIEMEIKATLEELITPINQALEGILPVKPKTKTKIQLTKLNMSIQELYTNTNIIHLHSAAKSIYDCIAKLSAKISPPNYHTRREWVNDPEDITTYFHTIKTLKSVAQGNAGVQHSIENYHLYITKYKAIPHPKPKKKFSWPWKKAAVEQS